MTAILLLLSTTFCIAQTEMADKLRADGKIYVVIVVIATIFAAIFAYMVILDRKISRLETNKN